MIHTKQEESHLIDVEEVKIYQLIVFNDDINTFAFVIDTLIKVCGLSAHQAEQCSLIIHYNGKCAVRNGEFEKLVPLRDAICERGIGAEIE